MTRSEKPESNRISLKNLSLILLTMMFAWLCFVLGVKELRKHADNNAVEEETTTRKCIWREGNVSMDILDGHKYIITYSAEGTTPPRCIHAESCKCKKER